MSEDEFEVTPVEEPYKKKFSRLKRAIAPEALDSVAPQDTDEPTELQHSVNALAQSLGSIEASQSGLSGHESDSTSRKDLPESAQKESEDRDTKPQGSQSVDDQAHTSENDEGGNSPSGQERSGHWDEEDDQVEALKDFKGNLGRPGSESDREESSGGNSDSEGQQTDDAGRTDSEEDDDEEDTNNWDEDNDGHVPQGTKSRPARIASGLGAGPRQQLAPMDGVLAKLKEKHSAFVARSLQQNRVSLPSASLPKSSAKPTISNGSSDLLIASDDDNNQETETSVPTVPLNFAIGTETQEDFPMFEAQAQTEPDSSPPMAEVQDSQLDALGPKKTPQKTPFFEMARRFAEERKTGQKDVSQGGRGVLASPSYDHFSNRKQNVKTFSAATEPKNLAQAISEADQKSVSPQNKDAPDMDSHLQPQSERLGNDAQINIENSVAAEKHDKPLSPVRKDVMNNSASDVALEANIQSGKPPGLLEPQLALDNKIGLSDQPNPSDPVQDEAGHVTKPPVEQVPELDRHMSEDEASYHDSASESDASSGEDDEDQEESPDAKERAMLEARAMLKDKRSGKKRRKDYMEEEAEMSEDGGHSDDGTDDSEEDAEHEEVLEDLIGYERERKSDAKRRAEAHAAWLEKEDERDMKRLMDGIQNGFKRRKGHELLSVEDGSLADARRRRAAVDADMEGDSSDGSQEGSDSSSESEEEDTAPKQIDEKRLQELSDDEEKENLQRYQQQKLLNESQVEDQVLMELVDADSQALLDTLNGPNGEDLEPIPQKQAPVKTAFAFSPHEVRKASVTASFLGRSGVGVSNSSRPNSQQNTKSYIFGRDDSNSAHEVLNDDKENVDRNPVRGPTSFAGIKRSSFGTNIEGKQLSLGLLDKLGPLVKEQQNVSLRQESSTARQKSFDFKEVLRKSVKNTRRSVLGSR